MKRPRVAADIMVTRLLKLLPEANVFEGVARLLKDNVTGAPVVDRSGTYLGIFSERCCLGVLMAAARTAGVGPSAQLPPARDVMSTQLLTFTLRWMPSRRLACFSSGASRVPRLWTKSGDFLESSPRIRA